MDMFGSNTECCLQLKRFWSITNLSDLRQSSVPWRMEMSRSNGGRTWKRMGAWRLVDLRAYLPKTERLQPKKESRSRLDSTWCRFLFKMSNSGFILRYKLCVRRLEVLPCHWEYWTQQARRLQRGEKRVKLHARLGYMKKGIMQCSLDEISPK
jgi:hypothetical protein